MKYLFHITLFIILSISALVFYLWYDDEEYFWKNVEYYLGSDARNYAEPKVRILRGNKPKNELQESDSKERKSGELTTDEPRTRYPLEDTQSSQQSKKKDSDLLESKPLPTLEKSDAALKQDLVEIINSRQLKKLFNLQNIIGRFVVTVDNLTYKNLPSKYRLFKRLNGKFLIKKDSMGQMFIHEDNYRRYNEIVDLIIEVDTRELVSFYKRYYPLIQKAYNNLGYPDKYFNDVLVDAVDHLLDAPELKDPIALIRPSVYYKYADPTLEDLSGGQKILLRIGRKNALKLKTKLKSIRRELAHTQNSLQ